MQPAVSVGVPVHNGARFLRNCLECLRLQTFSGIEVLIFDNASTDATEAIARDFVARDPRFSYFRQTENKGPVKNFADVLQVARRPYFLWRAADDLSDLNYVEVLHGLLAQRPDKDLAVSRVVTRAYDDSFEVEHRYPGDLRLPGVFGCASRSLRAHGASWFYGLFRREVIASIWLDVVRRYRDANASDHLTLFPLLLDDRVRRQQCDVLHSGGAGGRRTQVASARRRSARRKDRTEESSLNWRANKSRHALRIRSRARRTISSLGFTRTRRFAVGGRWSGAGRRGV